MIVGLVELLWSRVDLGLIKVVDPARDVRVLELGELLTPLGQGKVDKLALGCVLDRDARELESHFGVTWVHATECGPYITRFYASLEELFE